MLAREFAFPRPIGGSMMMYLGIDQHARQLTISLRDERGDVIPAWRDVVNFKQTRSRSNRMSGVGPLV